MICKEIKTNKLFNYCFKESKNVELNDGINDSVEVDYHTWCKEFYIIDKWRNLNDYDIKYNENLENGKFSSS